MGVGNRCLANSFLIVKKNPETFEGRQVKKRLQVGDHLNSDFINTGLPKNPILEDNAPGNGWAADGKLGHHPLGACQAEQVYGPGAGPQEAADPDAEREPRKRSLFCLVSSVAES